MKARAGIKITIPDLPPKEQLSMVENTISMIKTFEKVAGEEGSSDLAQAYALRDKLKSQIEVTDMEESQPRKKTKVNANPQTK